MNSYFNFQPEGKGETLSIIVANNKHADQFDVVWILDENWSDEKNKWVEGSVTVSPRHEGDDYEYKVVVQASKGNNNQSYIAFDEVIFLNEKGNCDIQPSAAKPTETPPTVPPTIVPTTPAPTEPPGPVLVCNFESDLCGWQAQPSNNVTLNWQRKTAKEIGDGLGPDADLEGNQDKFFMIATKNKEDGTNNNVAKLKSPLFESQDHPIECFSFWYFFGKQGQGESLTVTVEHAEMDPKVIWSLDQSWAEEEKWYLGTVEVTPIEAAEKPQYQIVVTTNKFGNQNSFVAVDQFEFLQVSKCELSPAQAAPTPAPTEPPGPVILCSFEENLCQWQVVTNDDSGDYKWARKTPTILSDNGFPGPDLDFEGSKDRYFMIASNAMAGAKDPQNAYARLESPYFKSTEHEKECLKFWFNIGAEGKGETLTIMMVSNQEEDKFQPIWVIDETWSGEKNKWTQGQVTFQPDMINDEFEYKVVVQANKGQNNQSYIAFDEVLFLTEKAECTLEPPEAKPTPAPTPTTTPASTTPIPTEPPGPVILCDFEQGLCQWSVEGGDWYQWEHFNAKNLAGEDFAGPDADYQGHDDKYFIIAHLTDNAYSGDQNVLTKIKSPLFEVNEHPVECFSFYYIFDVSYTFSFLSISFDDFHFYFATAERWRRK